MNPIEVEIEKINDAVLEMIELVKAQLSRSRDSFMNSDEELAHQIIHTETRVNSLELTIDKYCENTIARFSPVATDLRFVVSMLKINSDLERIGDYAESIADYVLNINHKLEKTLMDNVRTDEMFNLAIEMLELIADAYATDNSKKMKKLFAKDKVLNQINKEKSQVIAEYVLANPSTIHDCLYLHSTIKKLERVGDHAKNIAENYIFYSDAKVLKHKK